MPRLVAVALWLLVAALAVAGFANFSPQAAPETTTTTTIPLPARGSATGQVMARALAAGLRTTADTATTFVEDPELDPLFADLQVLPPPPDPITTTTSTTTTIRRPRSTTTTAPASTTNTPRIPMTEDEARSIIALYFKPEDVEQALTIAKCESTLIPDNINKRSGASGLFQHLPKYWAERSTAAGYGNADILDPYANTAVAAWLVYHDGGWSHWTCYRG
jgi:hypothetical protein